MYPQLGEVVRVKKVIFDERDEILEWLTKNERTLRWLAKKADIKYHGLYACLVHRAYKLSDINLEKINRVLGTEFKRLEK